ncbi:hypothetical protein CT0861_10920 [Colletotrichum tofieldiae]|uniref:Uncharacterized protein n=1 Tax=Colletotrichum tofieldiae TaxID=708197 RepID=A0A166Y4F1_9PEZI|nr:hypothetical protein CT0861_10920 [Colletotrichum tofieldiae]
MATSRQFPGTNGFWSEESPKEVPRLRFDDFSYESRISGPQSPTRPLPPRHRASWAFPLRHRSGFGLDLSASSESNNTSRSTISTGGTTSEPPPSGIMKTMEFQLSYEARTWTRRGRTMPQSETTKVRPSTIADMRSITAGDVPLFQEGMLPNSLNLNVRDDYQQPSYRHSSPPGSHWEWLANGQMRPISMNGTAQSPLGPTPLTTDEERLSTPTRRRRDSRTNECS